MSRQRKEDIAAVLKANIKKSSSALATRLLILGSAKRQVIRENRSTANSEDEKSITQL